MESQSSKVQHTLGGWYGSCEQAGQDALARPYLYQIGSYYLHYQHY